MTLEFFFCIALLVMVWCLVLRIEKLEQWRRDVESTGLESPSQESSK